MDKKYIDIAESILETAKQLPEEYKLIGAGMLMGLTAKVAAEEKKEAC